MTVKELKEKLEEFDDNTTVTMEQEYNGNGGVTNIDYIKENNYEDNEIILMIKWY